MSVRIFLGIALAALSGGAQASSLVFTGAPASTPSVLTLKAADPAKASDLVSVVAAGEPDVTYEKVAAIPNPPEAPHGFSQEFMIIRGGVVGGAFSTPSQGKAPAAAPVPTPAKATASAAPTPNAQKKSVAPAAAPLPASGVGKVK